MHNTCDWWVSCTHCLGFSSSLSFAECLSIIVHSFFFLNIFVYLSKLFSKFQANSFVLQQARLSCTFIVSCVTLSVCVFTHFLLVLAFLVIYFFCLRNHYNYRHYHYYHFSISLALAVPMYHPPPTDVPVLVPPQARCAHRRRISDSGESHEIVTRSCL